MKKATLTAGIFLYLLIFTVLSCRAQDESISDSSLVYKWRILSLNVNNGTSPKAGAQFLELLADHRFNLLQGPESIQQTGGWRLKNDSLLLIHELIAIEESIDSIVYRSQNDSAILVFFHEGKEVAYTDMDGLQSKRRSESYHIVQEEGGKIRLKGKQNTYLLQGPSPLVEVPFRWMDLIRGLLGIAVLIGITYLLSENKKAIDWRLVGTGVIMQIAFAILLLKVNGIKEGFEYIAESLVVLLNFTLAGSEFMFGDIVADIEDNGYIFAFQALPIIVFFSALMSILYYAGILQKLVYGFAWIMNKTMRLSGSESLATAGNIFLGQTESPLLVKPYLAKMTRSELMLLMSSGFATIAGSVFAAYVGYLGGTDPVQQQLFAKHLLTASIISAPASLIAAKMIIPETQEIDTKMHITRDQIGDNLLDAIVTGIHDGLRLAINVGIMLLVFIALIEMVNYMVGEKLGAWTGLNAWVTEWTDGRFTQFNLQFILGLICAPIAWILGTPSEDTLVVGQLLGEKTIINEFVAYVSLADAKASGTIQNYKSIIIATYALCGFANFASIGIQIGGISAIAPSQRPNLVRLGLKAMIAGTIAGFMTAAVAGMILGL